MSFYSENNNNSRIFGFNQSLIKSDQVKIKSNSFSTILALINSMVGTIVLLIPTNFLDAGIFSSIICMVIVGYISYKTCLFIIESM